MIVRWNMDHAVAAMNQIERRVFLLAATVLAHAAIDAERHNHRFARHNIKVGKWRDIDLADSRAGINPLQGAVGW